MKRFLLFFSLFLFGVMQNANAQSFNKPKGYMGLVEIGGGLGFGDWKADHVSFSMINGYRIAPQFAIGVGIGIQMASYTIEHESPYEHENKTDFSLPVFMHLRSDFINGKVSPFVALNIGYNILLSGTLGDAVPAAQGGGNYYDRVSFDGLILEPMAGIGFNVGRNRMTVGVGFLLNQMKYTLNSYSEKEMGTAITFKVGYTF